MFKRAVKHDAKLRAAFCGPAGSGKTYSILATASAMCKKIAYVDTEHGSASKYADIFNFDVIEPDTFDPRELIKFIKAAVENGYDGIGIDSLSHYWMGTGGELDLVDSAAKKIQGNSFAAWKNVTPIHNQLVETIISAPIHIFVGMRTKTEWVIEKNDQGKSVPRKVGLAPVMRDGIEFEFDLCGDLDQENNFIITKSRCPELSGRVINRPGKDLAMVLKKWLTGSGQKPEVKQPEPKCETPKSEPAKAEPEKPKDQPPTQPKKDPDQPIHTKPEMTGKQVADQLKKIKELAIASGCKNQDEIRKLIGSMIGREIEAATNLSAEERESVLRDLEDHTRKDSK